MRKLIEIALIAFFLIMVFSSLALAEDESDDENEREQNDENENENRMPGFGVVLAIACSLVAVKLHRRAS